MITIIDNILDTETANKLVTDIHNTPSTWWSYAYKVHNNDTHYLGHSLSFERAFETMDKELCSSLRQGSFSYKFRRSTKHVENCDCYECTFKKEYLLKSIKHIIMETCKLKNPYLFESFISIYSEGDFLGSHTDGKRNIAFVLNLTKDWKPEYGGLLNIRNEDNTYTAYVPKFNSLFLMDVTDEKSIHFVSEVTKFAPTQRIAISGWYNES
jgi:Rps23 Pro-64 3,4-dihydroxylase Tpa1-like proline 4-hydroxylase